MCFNKNIDDVLEQIKNKPITSFVVAVAISKQN